MLEKYYAYFRALSLDVALGAMIMQAFINRLLDIPWDASLSLALGLSVWFVYTLDHMLDARLAKGLPQSFRHRFHFQNRQWLSLVLLPVGGFLLYQFLQVSGALKMLILALFFLLLLLLFLNLKYRKKSIWFKELMVALGYSIGVMAHGFTEAGLEAGSLLIFFLIFLLAYMNLLTFSLIERSLDDREGHPSIARVVKEWHIRQIFQVITIIYAIVLILYLYAMLGTLFSFAVWLAMGIVMASVFFLSDIFSAQERYRVFGDGIFLFPILYLILT